MNDRERPPFFAHLLARLLISGDASEFIVGDLEELYALRLGEAGGRRARRWYRRAVVRSIAARLLRRRSLGMPPSRGGRNGGGVMGDIGSDVRFAWRSLMRRPGFTALALLVLAIGIGANTMVFAMTNQAMFRPLSGVRDPGGADFITLVSTETGRPANLSSPNFEDIRSAATLFDGLAGYRLTSFIGTAGDGLPVEAWALAVEGDYFELLGVRPSAGRLLGAEETLPRADGSVVVISERLWETMFARSPDAIGRTIRVNRDRLLTVIGVAGDGFAGATRGMTIDAWLPIAGLATLSGSDPGTLQDRSRVLMDELIGRRADGASVEAASSQLAQLAEGLAQAYPAEADFLAKTTPRIYEGLSVAPLIRERTEQTVRILFGVVGLVMVIACANLANLLLVRGSRRRGEIAVRRALGASSLRVFRQLMIESGLLALMGGVAGIAVAYGLAEIFQGQRFIRLPPFEGLSPDWRVLAFMFATVITTALLGGCVPALVAGRAAFVGGLKEAGARDTGGRPVLRSTITVVQISLSMALLVAALLLTRTMRNLYSVDVGLDPEPLVTFSMNAMPAHYSPDEKDALYHRVYDELRTVPGVEGVALDMYGPFSGGTMLGSLQPPDGAEQPIRIEQRYATPGYFETLGIRIESGRGFRDDDWTESGRTNVVLTRALARRFFGDADPIGRTLITSSRQPETYTVIGVIRDVRLLGPSEDIAEAVIQPFGAIPIPIVTVLIRTRERGPRINAAIRAAMQAAAPDIPVADPVPLADKLAERTGEQHLFAQLLTVLASLAVFLATVGLYGVIAWTVAGRTREIGIRMALGARAGRVLTWLLAPATGIVAIGIALGILGAFGIARLIENQLFGIEPLDAGTYIAAAGLFAVVALLACLTPARTALRVDPMVALRPE